MKLNRLMLAGLLSLSLSATSAYACDHGSSGDDQSHSWFSCFWHHCDHDHDGDQGHNQGSGQDGHQCSGGSGNNGGGSGRTSGGSGNTSGGSGSTSTSGGKGNI